MENIVLISDSIKRLWKRLKQRRALIYVSDKVTFQRFCFLSGLFTLGLYTQCDYLCRLLFCSDPWC